MDQGSRAPNSWVGETATAALNTSSLGSAYVLCFSHGMAMPQCLESIGRLALKSFHANLKASVAEVSVADKIAWLFEQMMTGPISGIGEVEDGGGEIGSIHSKALHPAAAPRRRAIAGAADRVRTCGDALDDIGMANGMGDSSFFGPGTDMLSAVVGDSSVDHVAPPAPMPMEERLALQQREEFEALQIAQSLAEQVHKVSQCFEPEGSGGVGMTSMSTTRVLGIGRPSSAPPARRRQSAKWGMLASRSSGTSLRAQRRAAEMQPTGLSSVVAKPTTTTARPGEKMNSGAPPRAKPQSTFAGPKRKSSKPAVDWPSRGQAAQVMAGPGNGYKTPARPDYYTQRPYSAGPRHSQQGGGANVAKDVVDSTLEALSTSPRRDYGLSQSQSSHSVGGSGFTQGQGQGQDGLKKQQVQQQRQHARIQLLREQRLGRLPLNGLAVGIEPLTLVREVLYPPECPFADVATHIDEAFFWQHFGDSDKALRLYQLALSRWEAECVAESNDQTGTSLEVKIYLHSAMGASHQSAGRQEEALACFVDAKREAAHLDEQHPERALALSNAAGA